MAREEKWRYLTTWVGISILLCELTSGPKDRLVTTAWTKSLVYYSPKEMFAWCMCVHLFFVSYHQLVHYCRWKNRAKKAGQGKYFAGKTQSINKEWDNHSVLLCVNDKVKWIGNWFWTLRIENNFINKGLSDSPLVKALASLETYYFGNQITSQKLKN